MKFVLSFRFSGVLLVPQHSVAPVFALFQITRGTQRAYGPTDSEVLTWLPNPVILSLEEVEKKQKGVWECLFSCGGRGMSGGRKERSKSVFRILSLAQYKNTTKQRLDRRLLYLVSIVCAPGHCPQSYSFKCQSWPETTRFAFVRLCEISECTRVYKWRQFDVIMALSRIHSPTGNKRREKSINRNTKGMFYSGTFFLFRRGANFFRMLASRRSN